MNGKAIGARLFAGIAGCGLFIAAAIPNAEEVPQVQEQPAIEKLDGERYRIDNILIDKAKGEFTVPGRVLELRDEDSPVEFIAITKGGYKSYEAVFELDTSAVAFNLACILIGLDADRATRPKRHFDPDPVTGDAVDIQVSWEEDGTIRQMAVAETLRMSKKPGQGDEWIYTGSYFGVLGNYMAETVGTLVGFVHDPESILQHRHGLGLGDYGAVTQNHEVLPDPGTPVRIHVHRAMRTDSPSSRSPH